MALGLSCGLLLSAASLISAASCSPSLRSPDSVPLESFDGGAVAANGASSAHVAAAVGRLRSALRASNASASAFECRDCFNFLTCCEDELLAVILNGGADSCSTLCSYFKGGYYSVCDSVCNVVGWAVLYHYLSADDVYPVHVCSEFKMCINNTCFNNCVARVDATPQPSAVPVGNTLYVNVSVTALRACGDGEVQLDIDFPSSPVRRKVVRSISATPYSSTKASNIVIPVDTGIAADHWTKGKYHGVARVCGGDCDDTKAGVVFKTASFSFDLVSAVHHADTRSHVAVVAGDD